MTWDQSPGVYTEFAGTSALMIGPHNLATRNGIMLNDRRMLECFWVQTWDGFAYPQLSVTDEPNPQETGTNPAPAKHGARQMSMTGWIQAGSYPQLLNMGRALVDAFLEPYEMQMLLTVAPFGLFTQPDVYINCRPSDAVQLSGEIKASDLSGRVTQNFTISLRASDPTFKSTVERYASVNPLTVAIPGRPYDRVYDLSYNELLDLTGSIVSGGGANVLEVTNQGNWDAPVRIRVTGSMSQITVVNLTTQQAMYFANVADGDYIEVDTRPTQGQITDQNGIVNSQLLDSRSDWITLQGKRGSATGVNQLALYVEDYEPGSKLEIWWNDTWL